MADDTAPPAHGWMPRERCEALVRGDGCPLCHDIAKAEPANPFSFLVADLHIGHLRLARNQHLPGYCVLIARQHVREPHADRELLLSAAEYGRGHGRLRGTAIAPGGPAEWP